MSSYESRLRQFVGKFEAVAGQIERIVIDLDLDGHKELLRRDIALLDDLHEETKRSVQFLEAHIRASKEFGEDFRGGGAHGSTDRRATHCADPGAGMRSRRARAFVRHALGFLVAAMPAVGLAGCGKSGTEIAIVTGSENQPFAPPVQEFCASKGAKCTFTYWARSTSGSP